jgi:hypothetical protein
MEIPAISSTGNPVEVETEIDVNFTLMK